MSSYSLNNEAVLGDSITDATHISNTIERSNFTKNSIVIEIADILNSKSGEEWSSNILLAVIHNLSYDESVYGRFGTPDNDIHRAVIRSGSGKRSWVKLLGVKMRVLNLQLNNLGLSDTHKHRITQLDDDFKQVFPAKLPQEYHPYATIS